MQEKVIVQEIPQVVEQIQEQIVETIDDETSSHVDQLELHVEPQKHGEEG